VRLRDKDFMQRRALIACPSLLLAQSSQSVPMIPDIVQEMVGVSHRDAKRVAQILDMQPGLVNASIDWGFGDWESALDAASHVGNREVAEVLLRRGARPTIFSAAMLGQVEVVKHFVATQVGIQKTYGPHGITLYSHARSDGMREYLKSLGDADAKLPSLAVSAEEREAISGRFGSSAGDFTIDVQNDRLGIAGPGIRSRVLLHHKGAGQFYPSGAPWVKIALVKPGFLSIQGGGLDIEAQRG
jgi:hypothetical protein